MLVHQDNPAPIVAAPQADSQNLLRQILKLRWLGMEGEAERISHLVALVSPAECQLFAPVDTD
jgi:hypothetical protein